jgi:hypothetical protein
VPSAHTWHRKRNGRHGATGGTEKGMGRQKQAVYGDMMEY